VTCNLNPVLDPKDWNAFRTQAHRALDEALDFVQNVRERPVWREMPDDVKAELREPFPQEPSDFSAVYERFARTILPYATGNIHPRFWGWVHGTGTAQGAFADFLAGAMNSNVGGRNHGAVYVERQVLTWFKELFGWPESASGILVAGTSAANAIAVMVARTKALGTGVRESGLDQAHRQLVAYASAATHSCVRKAFEAAGLGSLALRVLDVDSAHRTDPRLIEDAIRRDRAAGLRPFFIVGNAGAVDTGAVDPLDDLADLARREDVWFHVDGAFGAMAYLSPKLRPLLRGIERADSLAFDFHKWLHVPYDAGCVLVRDGELHRATFASEGPYLTRMPRGLAGASPWFADYGIDLSRGFRALKIWFTIQEHGAKRLGEAIERNCDQAQYLASRIRAGDTFDVVAPVALNIVCFRPRLPYDDTTADHITDAAIIALQESGEAVISSTTIDGRRAMRVCVANHRSTESDFDAMLATLERITVQAAAEATEAAP